MGADLSHYKTADMPVPASTPERLAGVISHGSMLLAMPIVIPLVVLVIHPFLIGPSRFARHTAIQALLFQLLVTVVSGTLLAITSFMFLALPSVFPPFALFSWPLAAVFGLLGGLVLLWGGFIEVVATYKAFAGEPYRMPIVGSIGA